jgi:outer membrane protein OmpA-like peptidoglycan-associated protein
MGDQAGAWALAQQVQQIRQNEASLAEATTSSALLAQTRAAERQRAQVLAAELAAELGEQIVSPRQVLAGWEPLEQALEALAKTAEARGRLASRLEQAEQRLAQFAQRLQGENKNVYLEIQGYTDSTGTPEHNDQLGEQRAEAVRRFLNRQGVALNRMATISYGQEQPVASNDTPEGRSQNRRVTIVVLA